MDGRRFDSFTKQVAGTSRRSLIKAALSTMLGGALAVTELTDSDASTLRKLGQICRKDGDCRSGRCGPRDSHGRGRCLCNVGADCPTPRNKCEEAMCTPDGVCGVGQKNCDDGNACTFDSCDPRIGCTHTQVICDDSNACTRDTCDPQLGCVYTEIDCDDGNLCTNNTCDRVKGCVSTNVECPKMCDPEVGCVDCLTASDCPDPLVPCQVNTCIDGVCGTSRAELNSSCKSNVTVGFPGLCDVDGTCCPTGGLGYINDDGVCSCDYVFDSFHQCCPAQILVGNFCA